MQELCPVCKREAFYRPSAVVESYDNNWIHEECRVAFMSLVMEFMYHPAHGSGVHHYWVERFFYFTKTRSEPVR